MKFLPPCLLLLTLLLQAPSTLAAKPSVWTRLKSCDPAVSLEAAAAILNDQATLKDPGKMFSPAYYLFIHGREQEAVFWFYAAQLRFRIQAVIKGGDHAQILSIMLGTVGPPIMNHAYQDIERLGRTFDEVLAWDRATPDPARAKVGSGEVEAKIDAVYSALADHRARLAADREALERTAREEAPALRARYAQIQKPCLEERATAGAGQ
jgi:hypothetical protein